MLSEIARKWKSMGDKKAGDEATRWAGRHIQNHSNCCESSRSPRHSITQGHAPNNIEVLAVCSSRLSSPQFMFLLMSQRWLCQLQLSTTGGQHVRELARKFWSSTITKTTRSKDLYSSDSAGYVAGFNESFHETSCSDHSLASMDDHMFNGDCFGDSHWRGFTSKNSVKIRQEFLLRLHSPIRLLEKKIIKVTSQCFQDVIEVAKQDFLKELNETFPSLLLGDIIVFNQVKHSHN